MQVESALLSTFKADCQAILGKSYSKIGPKAEAMLLDVKEVNRLIYVLLNSNCVTFYECLVNLRIFGSGVNASEVENKFSIFRFCDPDTEKLLQTLTRLAKERMYLIKDRPKKLQSNLEDYQDDND